MHLQKKEKRKKENVSIWFNIDMQCPFAIPSPWMYGHGGGVGLMPTFIGGPWVSVNHIYMYMESSLEVDCFTQGGVGLASF